VLPSWRKHLTGDRVGELSGHLIHSKALSDRHIGGHTSGRQFDRIPAPKHELTHSTGNHRTDEVADLPLPVAEDDIDRPAHAERVHLVGALKYEALAWFERGCTDQSFTAFRPAPGPPSSIGKDVTGAGDDFGTHALVGYGLPLGLNASKSSIGPR